MVSETTWKQIERQKLRQRGLRTRRLGRLNQLGVGGTGSGDGRHSRLISP